MSYHTRIRGSGGAELTLDSRTTGQAAVEAAEAMRPFAGGGAAIVVGTRRRRVAGLITPDTEREEEPRQADGLDGTAPTSDG